MTAAEIKREFEIGREFELTNHYITREDHPCFGTRRVKVLGSNSNSIGFLDRGVSQRVPWPRASGMEVWGDGTIAFRGGGCGQQKGELFLTFRRIA